MADEDYKRMLTAILSADVKGYSLLMADDEIATIQTITAYRNIMKSHIEQHNGRVVDSPGDNLLAEFKSVVEAVQCAIEIQKELRLKNDELPSERRMDFRIGVNLGDIVQDGERIYGDGVNIAARVEALADPGGVSISGTTFDNVRNKLNYGYRYAGEHEVKNVANPIRIYKVLTEPEHARKVLGEKRFLGKISRNVAIITILVLAVVAGGSISYYIYLHQAGRIEPALVENMAYPLPDLPSIAVLPFDNLSGDPEQEYLSDGITEHIISSLSKVPYIFVIARNSTYTYKGKPVKIKQVAENLGVRYVLEGSVQRSEDRVRITAQLIDATAGHHKWSENYDRRMEDIFVLQDDIAMKIMAALQIRLSVADLGKDSSVKTINIKAYEKLLKAWEHMWNRTEADVLQARNLAHEAIALDPKYGAPYIVLAQTHLDDIWFYRTKSRPQSLQTARQMIEKAIDLSGQDAFSQRAFGSYYLLSKDYDQAVIECQKATDMDPNSAQSNFHLGMALRFAGRFDEAIPVLQKAIRLNPVTPIPYLNNLAYAYLFSEQYEKAIPLWNSTIERNPDYLFAYMGLTCAYQLSGNEVMAREAAAEVMRIKPNLTVTKLEKGAATKSAQRKRMMEAFRKAGIPE